MKNIFLKLMVVSSLVVLGSGYSEETVAYKIIKVPPHKSLILVFFWSMER